MLTQYISNINTHQTHQYMYIVTLFIIAKAWKQWKCSSLDEWIKKNKKSSDIHTQRDIMRKKEILPVATAWMELWGHCAQWIKPEKKNATTVWSHLHEESKKVEVRNSEFVVDREWWVASRRKWRDVGQRYEFPVTRWINSGNLMYSMVTRVNCIEYLKVAKRVHLRCSHPTASTTNKY